MNNIAKRLQLSQPQYEQHVMNLWLNWCAGKTHDPRSLQKCLCCAPLFNWWQRELYALEDQFMYDTELHVQELDISTINAMYSDAVAPIFNRFSKPLLKRAINNKS